MESVATRIHETGLQLARQRDTFLTRTRQAGAAFLHETRDAGRQLATALQTEAKRWRRYATQRTSLLRTEAEAVLSVPAFERTVLTQLDGTLRALDARVRSRLTEIEGKPRKKAGKPERRKTAPRARKSHKTLPALAA